MCHSQLGTGGTHDIALHLRRVAASEALFGRRQSGLTFELGLTSTETVSIATGLIFRKSPETF